MPTSVCNLHDLAAEHTGLTRGSRLPHASIAFTFADASTANFKVDDWTNKKDPTKTELETALGARVISQALAREMVTDWDCTKSLLLTVLNTMYFGSLAANTWCDPASGGPYNFTLTASASVATANEKALFKWLVSSAAAIYYRETTMGTLNLNTLKLSEKPIPTNPATQTTHALKWTKLLQEMRREAKSRIIRNDRPPAYNSADEDSNTAYDTIIYDLWSDQSIGGFKSLIDKGFLKRGPSSRGYDYARSAKMYLGDSTEISKGLETQLSKAINHTRFVMYMEWRIGWELVAGTLA